MIDTDYQLIQRLIMEEANTGNLKGLIQLRSFLDEQISKMKVEDGQTIAIEQNQEEEHLEILNLKLSEFLSTKRYGIKFMRDDIIEAVKRLRNLNGIVLVAHSIGIGKTILLEEKGIGPRTIRKYESALNQYGYSLDKPLTKATLKRLKIYQKRM